MRQCCVLGHGAFVLQTDLRSIRARLFIIIIIMIINIIFIMVYRYDALCPSVPCYGVSYIAMTCYVVLCHVMTDIFSLLRAMSFCAMLCRIVYRYDALCRELPFHVRP